MLSIDMEYDDLEPQLAPVERRKENAALIALGCMKLAGFIYLYFFVF